ncbi:nuclear transport factor 2 family protein [Coralloluteibacterium stylophorae]|uniref:Nuclear transport factor 2 family protein n=1 Tax=Coralloluteibacterium stylophorae TaxID=1776034 RepID=A0A8J8B0I1_9GAMM|nr:nuclear transport factor 2 family protein [Coralloluteibacterium stylophorae]MBS7455730.1 nuclear transport factor 2 family protein [Coralloluteibacterium stylophorae]
MSSELPDCVARYFAADDTTDDRDLAACFSDDVRIHDEGGEHHGTAAALAWWHAARRRYDFHAEPREVQQDADRLTVRAQVTGTFPGSPIMLDHVFTLRGGRIAALAIG